MKHLAFSVLILSEFVSGTLGQADEKKVSTPTIKADYLEKRFSLKLTKTKIDGGDLVATFEFVNDAVDLTMLLEAIRPVQEIDGPKQLTKPSDEPKQLTDAKLPEVVVYGFDAENVPVVKKTISAVTTDVTGVKGDAFRVTVKGIGKSTDGDVAKIEFRPRMRPSNQTTTRPVDHPFIPFFGSATGIGSGPPRSNPPNPSIRRGGTVIRRFG